MITQTTYMMSTRLFEMLSMAQTSYTQSTWNKALTQEIELYMNILLSLEGVLSAESGEPIRAGVALYYALTGGNRVAILTSKSEEQAKHWLASHGIIDYDDLVTDYYGLHGEDLKRRQITIARSTAPVEMYVDADPETCAWVFEQGVTAVMFMPPSYLRIDRRPDTRRSWNEIEKAITEQNIARSNDKRLKDDVDLMWDEG